MLFYNNYIIRNQQSNPKKGGYEMETYLVKINSNGSVKVEGKEVFGPKCDEFIYDLAKRLGRIYHDQEKPERHIQIQTEVNQVKEELR